jgi:RNA polymerase sigma factor (sigma-70 family)
MATLQPHPLVRYVRALAAPSGTAGLSDAELLERFAAEGDEAAFAALVSRHGPLVLGACRRVLRHWHDAEDAFQATFLVLARRAGSVRLRALSPWLHEVATRTALKARAQAARRRTCERRLPRSPSEVPAEDVVWRDLRPLLDEAIGRLPEKYRVPVVLCYLEGRTVAEVARQLGCPRGTVAARLARGRERLRARLFRRGVALSAAALVTVTKGTASARVPGPLVVSTARAAVSAAAGRAGAGLLSARVAALVQGVNQAMLMKRMRTAALWLLGTIVVGGGIGLSVVATRVAAQPIPRAANGPPHAEGKESDGGGRPSGGEREPRVVETRTKQYQIELTVIQVDPRGEDLGPLGKGKVVAEPALIVPEGKEGSLCTGSEVAVPGDKGTGVEYLQSGLRLRFKVWALDGGRLRLEAILESNTIERADENGAQVRGTVMRTISRVRLGEAVKLVDRDDNGKVRNMAQVKVVSEKTVISQTRSAVPPAKDVLVGVKESGTGSLLFGVGVNSDAGLTGSVILNERNFDVKPAPTGTHKHPNDQGFRGAGQEFRLLTGLEYQVPVRANDEFYHVGFVDSGTVDKPSTTKQGSARPEPGNRLTIPAIGPVPVNIDFGFPVRKD